MANYKEWLQSEIRSKVYNALSDVAIDYADVDSEELKKQMDLAIEWFQIKYWENEEGL